VPARGRCGVWQATGAAAYQAGRRDAVESQRRALAPGRERVPAWAETAVGPRTAASTIGDGATNRAGHGSPLGRPILHHPSRAWHQSLVGPVADKAIRRIGV